MGTPSVMKIAFQQLILFPTDSEGNAAYNTDLGQYTRTIQIMRFYIAINFSNKDPTSKKKPGRRYATSKYFSDTHHRSPSSGLKSSPINIKAGVTDHTPKAEDDSDELRIEEEYQKIRDNDSYFILPLDFMMRIGKNQDASDANVNKPKSFMHIYLQESLIVFANKLLTKYITCLNQHVSVMKIVAKNLHLRPTQTPRENRVNWWKYAIQAVIEDLKRGQFVASNSIWKTLRNRKYIDFFKKKQDIVRLCSCQPALTI